MQGGLFGEEMAAENCIFCKILSGKAPGHIIYRDDDIMCFLDIAPVSMGHTLIIPVKHHDNIFTLSDSEVTALARQSKRLAPIVKRVTGADGLGVHQLNGRAAGQTVFHYHTHLIPCFHGQSMQIHGRKAAPQAELADMAERLRAALA
ncbi:Protein hit [Zhongshania aliphaticivorans]|uniref:Protein hit n=1 Tax=Zhongshania aliphaticivorans TaxID=1470434 RepID=A0A5S9NEC0_9GAMM|nr:HIT domain-containing protein [Zhongshania aliphaticivorans]CAA0088499.1 Protein hit [Zhongshania aliphaticivorans]CAA0094512.1 Protein hit [Zhongshania aliphaticivorans]